MWRGKNKISLIPSDIQDVCFVTNTGRWKWSVWLEWYLPSILEASTNHHIKTFRLYSKFHEIQCTSMGLGFERPATTIMESYKCSSAVISGWTWQKFEADNNVALGTSFNGWVEQVSMYKAPISSTRNKRHRRYRARSRKVSKYASQKWCFAFVKEKSWVYGRLFLLTQNCRSIYLRIKHKRKTIMSN